MKINYSFVILLVAMLSVGHSLNCSQVRFANGNSYQNSNECECEDNYIWIDDSCVQLFTLQEVGDVNTTDIPCQSSQYKSGTGDCVNCNSKLSACEQCDLSTGDTPSCTKCLSSFYLNSPNCVSCQTAIQNCFTCSSDAICTACKSGFSLSDDNTTCSSKPTCAVENCETCSSSDSSICSTCIGQYELSNDKKSCTLPDCAGDLIFNGVSCDCKDGFFLNSGLSSCTACTTNCLACSGSSTNCSECANGYSFTGTICANCATKTEDPYCIECLGTSCSGCQIGYSLVSGICTEAILGQSGIAKSSNGTKISCSDGCAQCTSQTSCTNCNPGYSLYNLQCFGCGANCRQCTYDSTETITSLATKVCLTCFEGYSLSSGQCSDCIDTNCSTCLNPNFCTKCITGFAPDSNGLCKECFQGCQSCQSNGHGKCDPQQCVSGYGYNSNTQICIKCLSGCSTCDDSFFKCTSCAQGQYKVSQNTTKLICGICPDSCKVCTSLTNCSDCNFGYFLTSNKTSCAKNCIYPCDSCSETNHLNCLKCFGGYKLNGNSCVIDIACNANLSCEVCPKGYQLVDGNCSECNVKSISNCNGCQKSSLTTCSSCNSGFYLAANNNSCVKCRTGCATCASRRFCYQAQSGYVITSVSEGIYQQCDSNCLTCQFAIDNCASCKPGFTLVSSYCQSNQKVLAQYVLNTPSGAAFDTQDFADLLDDFITALAQRLKLRKRSITFTSVVDGSINITSQITVQEGKQPSAILSSAESILSEGAQIGGLKIESASVSSSGFILDTSSANLGLILGVSIPLLLLVLALLVFIAFKLVGDQNYKSVYESQKGYGSTSTDQNYEAGI